MLQKAVIDLSYEDFIRSLKLFYTGKLQMSDINPKAINQSGKCNAFYMCKWQCNQKAQGKNAFNITVMRKIYYRRSQFHKSNNNKSLRHMRWYILALVLSLRLYSLILPYQNRYRYYLHNSYITVKHHTSFQ